MTTIVQGISYNFRGLRLGLGTSRLLMLGLLRFALLVVISVAAAAVILENYQEILNLMWNRPASPWIAWLWHVVSWLLALVLLAISTVVGFLIAQILFSVVIMDRMSQITERMTTGGVQTGASIAWYRYFFHLLRQEIPRGVLPVLISLLLLVLGWFTPLGPVFTVLSPLAAALFLAWDNTDLVPARRMLPFGERFALLRQNFGFHLGFGLPFLIPVLNLVLLSFAPVGATLYYTEKIDSQKRPQGPTPGVAGEAAAG
ncbi:MAG: EI24 domain-containing protein [Desulfobacterales bacterium]|nr:EI24 domain-containing protein [Desulfobacterales bacterium]